MTTPAQLDERYGRTGSRRVGWVIGGIIAAALIGVFSWWTVAANIETVSAADHGFVVVDEHLVEVTFTVSTPLERDIACALEALDAEFGIVGWKIVQYPAQPEHTQRHTETIPTVAEATTGLVNSCWLI